jgi:iron complex outermembrane receptor protein
MSLRKITVRRTALVIAIVASMQNVAFARADDDAAATKDTHQAKTMEAVSVVASGETRQVQKVGAEDIQARAPGTSALKVIDELPGVNFQAADPWGAYEWSTQITLHGFDQSRLGFTLDGIPLGNMTYGTTTGLQVSRAVTSENLATVELAQGAGALGTASNTNLGGTVQFFTADPDKQAGVRFNQVFGSDATRRSYARLDSGDFGGWSAYLSYVHGETDKWKGYGDQRYDQLNLKTVFQWSSGRVALFVDSSRRKEYDYMDLSLVSRKALGWNFDYLQPDWNTAVQMANAINGHGAYPAQFDALPSGYPVSDVDYYAGGGLRHDNLAGLSGNFNLGENVTLDLGGYYHDNRGEGQWTTPYQASSPTMPLSMRTTDYGLDRYGATGALQWTLGNHDIEAGFWTEDATTNQERNYFRLYGPYTGLWNFYDGETPFLRGFLQHYTSRTTMGYVEDTVHLLDDRLTVNFGAKTLGVTNRAQSLVPTTAFAQGRVRASKGFLPQLGVNYKLDERQELYASYSKNLNAYGFLPFSQAQASFDAGKRHLKPEESQTYELGYRVRSESFEASVDGYHTRFSNRLLAVTPCSAVQTCANVLSNVGSVKSDGVDFALIWKPAEGLRWLNTVSWDSTKYQDDYVNHGVIPTKDKYVVGIPTWMYTSDVSYRFGPWQVTLDGKYTGRRFITYVNDSKVPSYWLFNAGIDYDLGALSVLKDVRLGLNVTNLFDKHYYATTGTNGYVASDPLGWNQTLMAGAPRQVFFNLDARF